MSSDVVILGGSRTPFGRLNGQLASLSAVELGAHAIRAALEQAKVSPDDVDQVVMGQVLQAGAGQGPARQAAIKAGIDWKTPAVTINKVCLSGVAAIVDAARLIRAGEASVVVAGGQESMSNAPHLLPGSRRGWPYGSVEMLDHAAHDGLTDAFDRESMGISTDKGNTGHGITREEQDEIAAESHRRAGRAQAEGVFEREIAPIDIPQRRGEPVRIAADEGVRPDSTAETLAKLRPAFLSEGTITAGNSSPLNDGAAAVVVASREWAEARGLDWLCFVEASGSVAGPDNSLHEQPANAIGSALAKQGWSVDELDVIEINEAFAAVSARSIAALGADPARVDIHGGAIALGHPIGASGARLALHAALELDRRGGGRAAVALCGGGGQGDALLLSR
ncbi:acetyl-CoA C-acetyltransferase [Agromyces archimandritae]|uniref:Probable acetyl-CoA acetyltransferase n=1 Tax=Agromyces archimandritae TaxID=2781962 RepID=A0A975IP02_9MICO|nr:acetyl-CoA C-acetyltransferase [Agromyces archimandritae]QTX05122.1 acetyl-CoA C-acetyltransferase [Agromyces archimandritae]